MKKIRLTESDLRQTIIDSIGDDVPEHLIDRIADKIAAKLASMTQKRNTIGPNNNGGGCGYTPAGGCGSPVVSSGRFSSGGRCGSSYTYTGGC